MNSRVLKTITSKIEYYVLVCYIAFGYFFFTSSFAGRGYLDILLATSNNKIFLTIFLYPGFVYLWHLVIHYMSHDDMQLLRTNNRKTYTIKTLLQLLCATSLLYVQVLIILFICVNLTEHTGFIISYHMGYDVNDLVVFVVSSIRTFSNLIVFGVFYYYLTLVTRKKGTGNIFAFLLLIVTYFGDRFYPSGNQVLDIFNLGLQFYGCVLCDNISYFIFSGMIFMVLLMPFILWLIFRKTKRVDFGI